MTTPRRELSEGMKNEFETRDSRLNLLPLCRKSDNAHGLIGLEKNDVDGMVETFRKEMGFGVRRCSRIFQSPMMSRITRKET